ncbi:hypothetical protein F5883DRAFT_221028 [Diaporthe sp. PMI_573]|nr:hypothetical protein F5883DRAFT_221028 [Diaporthaceae sp. PMI_573]
MVTHFWGWDSFLLFPLPFAPLLHPLFLTIKDQDPGRRWMELAHSRETFLRGTSPQLGGAQSGTSSFTRSQPRPRGEQTYAATSVWDISVEKRKREKRKKKNWSPFPFLQQGSCHPPTNYLGTV